VPAFLDPLFRHPRLTVSKKSKQPFQALFELAFKYVESDGKFQPTLYEYP
jgi:hypothetical protein